MDAIDTKLNQLSTSFQQFYMSIINGEVVKGIVNIGQSFVDMFNQIGPMGTAVIVANLLKTLNTFIMYVVSMFVDAYKKIAANWEQTEKQKTEITKRYAKQRANADKEAQQESESVFTETKTTKLGDFLNQHGGKDKWIVGAQGVGLLLNILPSLVSSLDNVDKKTANTRIGLAQLGNVALGVGRMFAGDLVGGFLQAASGAIASISAFSNLEYTLEELESRQEEAQASAATTKKSYKDLSKLVDNYKKSVNDLEEHQEAANALVEAFPELGGVFDAEGNAVNDLTDAYTALLAVKREEAGTTQIEYLNRQLDVINKEKQEFLKSYSFLDSSTPIIRNTSDRYTPLINKSHWYGYTGLSDKEFTEFIISAQAELTENTTDSAKTIITNVFKAFNLSAANALGWQEQDWENLAEEISNYKVEDSNTLKNKEELQKIFKSYNLVTEQIFQNTITTMESFFQDVEDDAIKVSEEFKQSSVLMASSAKIAAKRLREVLGTQELTYQSYLENREVVTDSYNDLELALRNEYIVGDYEAVGEDLIDDINNIGNLTYNQLLNLKSYIEKVINQYKDLSQDENIPESTRTIFEGFVESMQSVYDSIGSDAQAKATEQQNSTLKSNLEKLGIKYNNFIGNLNKGLVTALINISDEQVRLAQDPDNLSKAEKITKFWENLTIAIQSKASELTQSQLAEVTAAVNNVDAASNLSEFSSMMQTLATYGIAPANWVTAFSDIISLLSVTQDDVDSIIKASIDKLKNVNKYLEKALNSTLSFEEASELVALGVDWSKFSYDEKKGGYSVPLDALLDAILAQMDEQIEALKIAEPDNAFVAKYEEYRNDFIDNFFESINNSIVKGLAEAGSNEEIKISQDTFNSLISQLNKKLTEATNEAEEKALQNIINFFTNNFSLDFLSGEMIFSGEAKDFFNYTQTIASIFAPDLEIDWNKIHESYNKTVSDNLTSNLTSAIGSIGDEFTISISNDLYEAFFKGEEGFVQTLDGYDFMRGPLAFIDLIDKLIYGIFSDQLTDEQKQSWERQKVGLESQALATERAAEIERNLSQVGRSSADYQKIVESLRDATASAEDAQVAIDELGISAEQLYKTFDGKIGIKGTKELFKTYDSLAELEADRQEIVKKLNDTNAENTAEYDKQNRLLQVQLGLLNSQEQELLKRQVEFANDSGYDFTYGSPYDLAANAASFKSEIATGKIKTETVFDLFNNLGWDSDEAATLMDAFTKNLSPSDKAIKDINQRWSAVKKAYGEWEPDSGDIVLNLGEADGEIVSAITEGTDNILYAMLERRIELLNNQIETNKAILQIGQNETLFANAKIEGFTLTDNTGNPITSVSELWNRYIIENLDSDILTATFSELNIDPRTINAEQLMQAINYILSNYQGDLAGIGVVVTPEVTEPPAPESIEAPINGDTDPLMDAYKTAKDEIEKDSVLVSVTAKIQDALDKINELIKTINNSRASLNVDVNYNNNVSDTSTSTPTIPSKFKKNVSSPGSKGLSQARGTSNAKGGRTLVGELGPELRVSNGQYSIVGGKGAEFVNLRKGDIIFNAQQTQELLSGTGNVRGQAFASGNLASSTEQLERELEELKSTLEALQKGSGSGAGDKGGSGGGSGSEEVKEYLMELEKWFNWLRRIEKLEYRISIIQAERENMTDGSDFAQSIYEENALLQKQADLYEGLRDEQLKYRDSLKTKYLEEYGRYFYFIGNALQINEEEILKDTKNNEELGEEIQKLIDDYKEVTQNIADNTTSYENNKKAIEDNIRTLRDKYIDMENEILDALENSYQKQIDLKQNELDRRIESDQKYLDALKKNLDKERQMREQANSQEERESLERKLALLERDTSGASDKEIASLRDQLRSTREEQYYNQREQSITDLEDSLEAQQQIVQSEIDVLTEANEIKLENMRLYWQEVADIIAQGSDNIMAFLQANSQEYVDASKIQQEDYTSSWKQTIDAALTYAEDMKKKFDELLYSMKEPEEHGEDTTPAPSTSESSGSSGGGGGGGGSSGGSSGGTTTKTETKPAAPATGTLRLIYKVKNRVLEDTKQTVNVSSINFASFLKSFDGYTFDHADPTYVQIQAGKTSTITYFYNKVEEKKTTTTTTTPSTTKKSTGGGGGTGLKSSVSYKAFAGGGLVNYTGPAWVDGTPARPEAFLNADDTKLLANFLECAKSMTMGYSNYRAASFSNNETINSGVTIDKVEVTIESGVVSNRNDAVNLGHGIADGLMDIARQSGTISVTRR